MAALIYPLLLWLALPLVWCRLWWRAKREPEYGLRKAERFGHVPDEIDQGVVWFHTVSAGESIAAAPLIREIASRLPNTKVLVTTMTPTGSAQVKSRLGDVVQHCYAPYDFNFAVKRFFDRVQPKCLVLMETELWPNLIGQAYKRNIPVCLVNARLSERSAKGYGRVSSLSRVMVERLSFIACQTQDHRERFQRLGASGDNVHVVGSVKYDINVPNDLADRISDLRQALNLADELVWIAASTHPGEEEVILAAHQQVLGDFPTAKLILVPRHPHRAASVVEQVAQFGFKPQLQSEIASQREFGGVLVGDVMGTLLELYGLADVAFVGGSLVAMGGHNPIEPAVLKVPVITGPNVFNFAETFADLIAQQAVAQVEVPQQLADEVVKLLADENLRSNRADLGFAYVQANRGATERTQGLLVNQLQTIGLIG